MNVHLNLLGDFIVNVVSGKPQIIPIPIYFFSIVSLTRQYLNFIQDDVIKTIKLSRHLSDLVAYTRSTAFKGLDITEDGMRREFVSWCMSSITSVTIGL